MGGGGRDRTGAAAGAAAPPRWDSPGTLAPSPAGRRLLSSALVALAVGALVWFAAQALLEVALLTGALAAALLLTALLEPAARALCRAGAPPALAAAVTTVVLLGSLVAVVVLVYSRSLAQLDDLRNALTLALDEVRRWLVAGPLQLEPAQVQELRNLAVDRLERAAPSAVGGAMTALKFMSAMVIAVFAVFFLLKDGPGMWAWALRWTPGQHRERVDIAGHAAWGALTSYVRGTVVVAAVDAVGIGAALLLLGVPLWLSLTLLTFVGAFVPLLGATLAGAAAVLATLVTEGAGDAVIVLVVVLVVQQVEGNLLQPLIMGHAVRLHPLVILCAVTAGTLLLGILGALIAVPLTAVAYRVAASLHPSAAGASGGPADSTA